MFLAGLVCIGVAIAGGGGAAGFESPVLDSILERVLLGLFGLGLVAGSLALTWHAHDAPRDPLADPAFWARVFDAMPPAFVKEYPSDAHLTDNAAFEDFQVHQRDPSEEDELERLICEEHRAGDRKAAEAGASVQFELSDRSPHGGPQPILTFKRCVTYGGRKYIVGWYVSVTRPDDVLGATVDLRERRGGVLFGYPALAAPDSDEDVFTIDVGVGARRWLESRRVAGRGSRA